MSVSGLSEQLGGTRRASTAAVGRPGVGESGVSVPHQRLSLVEFLIVAVQLGLFILVVRQFQVESNAFLRIAVLTVGGFMVHCWLPFRYRLPFFLLLSLIGIGLVFGFLSGAWLVTIGLILIGICHLPLPFPARGALLLLAAAVLAVLRVDWLHAPWSVAIWPILGSMFMFRLIVYFYDLRHDTAPVSVWRTLSYFFLLPNICFPLFPVVDYKTFRRNYYSDQEYRVYQVGIGWMVRGVIHLVLYRLVYYHLTLAPSDVTGLAELVQYLISNFLLYLRISGQFHLIVGMLHLFGFNLPETNHYYCLASSFSDFWRRINIYWKDFMLKVFYYPAYFRLRHRGTTQALVISTLFVFVVTWLLHSYQWFWLRGSFPATAQDALFWGILASLVVMNSLYEAKHSGGKTLGKAARRLRGFPVLALRTVGTFVAICVLWSLWTSESLSAWVGLWEPLRELAKADASFPTTLLVGAVVFGGASRRVGASSQGKMGLQSRGALKREDTSYGSAATTTTWLLLLSLIGIPAVYSQLGPTVATFVHSLRSGTLSRLDTARLEKGYYEELFRVDRFNSQLWEVYMNRPVHWLDAQGVGLERFTGDFLQRELVPSFVSATSGVPLRTNRWGMRDQDYERDPAADSYRIALLGASMVMGWGVEDNETFEALLEERLNRQHAGERYAKYEILNFGVSGYKPLQQLVVLQKSMSFRPNAVYYVAVGRELEQAAGYLEEVIRHRITVPYEYLRETAQRAGLEAAMSETVASRRIEPFREEILTWLYRSIVQECRERGILPVWVFLPMVHVATGREGVAARRLAEEAGFTVVDLGDVYKGHDPASLRLAEWDSHPNARGHALIAARLYEALRSKDATGALQLFAAKTLSSTVAGATVQH